MKKYLLSLVAISALLSQSGVLAKQYARSVAEGAQQAVQGIFQTTEDIEKQKERLEGEASDLRGESHYILRKAFRTTVEGIGVGVAAEALGVPPKVAVALAEVWELGRFLYFIGIRRFQRKEIDDILKTHTTYSFRTLTKEHALLVLAAYKRNVGLLKRLIQSMLEFVEQKGVWKAITELFYNKKPTSSRVKQLKKEISAARA